MVLNRRSVETDIKKIFSKLVLTGILHNYPRCRMTAHNDSTYSAWTTTAKPNTAMAGQVWSSRPSVITTQNKKKTDPNAFFWLDSWSDRLRATKLNVASISLSFLGPVTNFIVRRNRNIGTWSSSWNLNSSYIVKQAVWVRKDKKATRVSIQTGKRIVREGYKYTCSGGDKKI